MEASGISHIAICVWDMDKSLEFYRDRCDWPLRRAPSLP